MNLKFKRIKSSFRDIPLPKYETEGSAGMDIRAAVENDVVIAPKGFALIPTNLSVEIPVGYEIQVRPRSGLAAKYGIGVLNSPGTIDSDFRGEIKIILFNFSDYIFRVSNSDRIAQLIVSKVYRMEIEETDNLSETERGEGGFGSTGKN